MPARKGDTVSIRYTTTLQDGTVCESNRDDDPLSIVLGETDGMHTLEQAVIGLEPGMKASIVIPPEEAYGSWSEDAVEQVPASLFGEAAPSVGTAGTLVDEDGNAFPCCVVAVSDDLSIATVDFNHPLAGQSLNCDFELVEVTPKA